MTKLIVPQWPMPKGVAACSSTRVGGVSLPPYDSLNLGAHCGDDLLHVEEKPPADVCRWRITLLSGVAGAGAWHDGTKIGWRAVRVKTRRCVIL